MGFFMSAPIAPYLFFAGRCEEALELYQQALDAKVEMLMRFNDSPEPPPPETLEPGFETKVMHCSFRIGASLVMASDGCDSKTQFEGFRLAVSFPDEAAARQAFEKLADGGKIDLPLGPTFWAPLFGMLTDRFGLGWMVSVAPPEKG